MRMKTVSITISGKVQGVFYRQGTKEMATALGIKGAVRNMPDDTVNIIATGDPEKIARLIEWCRLGPPRARVFDVSVEEVPLQDFERFSIVR
jgi:acylphosphatase